MGWVFFRLLLGASVDLRDAVDVGDELNPLVLVYIFDMFVRILHSTTGKISR